MAIGDTLNQNPFGTDYNAEKEEKKKAELAAQNAMMGAGNVPASAFGQAPAVTPFSMEAAGKVNPMMEQQSLAVTPQAPNPATFLPYADDVAPPPASALSVFTPGGEVKPNVDVNAITPSPDVNAEANPQPPLNNALLEMLQRGDERQSMGLPRQAAPGIIDAPSSVVDPFTGQTIEKPTPFAADNSLPAGMTMNQAAIMNALPEQNQGMGMNQQAIANAQGQEVAQAQAPTAPTGGLTTVGGASLSEFLSGQAMPEQGFTQEESPLGGRGVTLTPDQMNELSAEREARLDARLPGDQSVSDRDRRAARGDGISMADQVAMAKANDPDATPREVARGNQVANALGVDLKTGQPLQATGGLTESELQRRREFAYKQEQDILAGETKAKETEGERSVNRAKAVGSLQALKADLDLIKETGEEVRTLTLKPRTEGLLAKALATVSPTSTAAQLERASGVLTGDAFIKGMQVIKAFGGGLGSVTEVEGLKVERAQGAIFENGMGDEERRQAVKDYIQVRENAYNRIREAFVKEYGETDAQTYLGTQNTNATAGKAIPNDRNVSVEVSPELEQYFN
jgi:hypothetical protein